MMIHVRHGKGNKDRYVPLPQSTLQMLRQYWAGHRNPVLLFPAEGRAHIDLRQSTESMSRSSVQDAFRAAVKESGINKLAPVHTLRHFLQHVLPERFIKVRYYGLLSPTNRHLLKRARELLTVNGVQYKSIDQSRDVKQPPEARSARCCPKCGSTGILVERLKPNGRSPP